MLMVLMVAPVSAGSAWRPLWESLEIETTLEARVDLRDNPDLDADTADDLAVFTAEMSLDVGYRFSDRAWGFLSLEPKGRLILHQGRDRTPERDQSELDLKELFIDIDDVYARTGLRAGRQEFKDRRQWLYDAELDGVRLIREWNGIALEAAVTRENIVTDNLLDDREPTRINNYFLLGRFQPATHNLDAFWLIFDDRSDDDQSPMFFGIQADGPVTDALDYWLALAQVRGQDGATRIRGEGFDLGATYRFDTQWTPSVTMGYAFGSGDSDPDDGVDRNFRQTELQDNASRFHGVEEFQLYGETLAPELSNLSVTTLGFGVRPSPRSSIDLVYHRYRQAEPVEGRLRGARIRAQTDGEHLDVGQSIDLIIGYHEISDFRMRAKLGYFTPGKAFGNKARSAYSAEFEIEYRF